MTLTAAAPLVVENHLPQAHPCTQEMVCKATELGIVPDEIVRGLYLPGTSRWESGLLVATMIMLGQNSNDPESRWIGFMLDDPNHWMAVVTLMAGKFPHAPLRADGGIDVPAIVEAAASDLGRAEFIETKTITIPGTEETSGESIVVIFPTAKLVKELDNCYGYKG
jgi:hypothetical protein